MTERWAVLICFDATSKVLNYFCPDSLLALSVYYHINIHNLIHIHNLLLFLIPIILHLQDVGTYYPADNQVLHKGKFTVHSSKVNVSHQYKIERELTIEFSGVCVSKSVPGKPCRDLYM